MNPEEFCTFIAASNALLTTGAAYGRRRPKTLDTVIPDLCVKGGVNISNNWENLQPRGGGCIAHSSIYGFVSDKPPAIEYGSTSSHLMLEGKSPTRNETVRQPAIALRKHLSTVLKSTVFREAVYEEHIGQYLAAAEKEVDENNKKTKALSMRSIDSKIMAVKKAGRNCNSSRPEHPGDASWLVRRRARRAEVVPKAGQCPKVTRHGHR